jgi:hypothetical protein
MIFPLPGTFPLETNNVPKPTTEVNPMPKPNRLSQENMLKLSDWLKSKKQSLETLAHSYKEIAKTASEELGFPIADNSIQRICTYLNIAFKSHPNQGGGKQAKINVIRLNKLRDHLVLLYQQVGLPTPPEIGLDW